MPSVRVKICGLTTVEDASAAVDLGADFLGLNFAAVSPRRIDVARAREIADAVRGRTSLVAVFVNQSASEIDRVLETVEPDLVQLHGDEGPDEAARHGDRALKVLRVDRCPSDEELDGYPDAWGFLVEARRQSAYGGTGRSWDYSLARQFSRRLSRASPGSFGARPFLLAGGLGPDNVAEAIMAARPWGVDVASGVESAPGRKDAELMHRFFQEVARVSA